jgi:hypothetical protein
LDWKGIKQLAFGPLNLSHEQFWSLTIAEFNDLVEGYVWREERQMERMAQLAVWITAPHLKKPWTVEKLLGKKKETEQPKITPEDKKKLFEEMDAIFGTST